MSYEYEDIEVGHQDEELDSNTRLLGALSHLVGFLPVLIGVAIILSPVVTLIFWMITRKNHQFLNDHGKEALNFQISLLIFFVPISVVSVPLFFVFGLGMLILVFFAIVLFLFWITFAIIAAIKANSGEWYRYPLTIRLVQ